jgi:DNA damage-binding protein 1
MQVLRSEQLLTLLCIFIGSLVMTNLENDAPAVPKLLFATVSGTIGVIATLTAEKYALLHHLESNMSKVIKGVGGLSHSS